jgi:hypothetical protein
MDLEHCLHWRHLEPTHLLLCCLVRVGPHLTRLLYDRMWRLRARGLVRVLWMGWMGSNGYMVHMVVVVDGIQVEKVSAANQSKSGNVWICIEMGRFVRLEPTHLTTTPTTLVALTALGAPSPRLSTVY